VYYFRVKNYKIKNYIEVYVRITQEADYAFRIVRVLGKKQEKIGSTEISEKTGIPQRFAFKILRKLTHSGITKSIRGKGGGYIIGKPLEEISLLEIIEVIDGPIKINKCLDKDYSCTMFTDNDCSLHFKLAEVGEKFRADLDAVKISEFIQG
jgi:Rrf2 family protein